MSLGGDRMVEHRRVQRAPHPHRPLPHRATPATVYQARPKAKPGTHTDTHDRVRTDRVDEAGSVTLRVAGRLHHIGVGRTHAEPAIGTSFPLWLYRVRGIRSLQDATSTNGLPLTAILRPVRDRVTRALALPPPGGRRLIVPR